MGVRASSPFVAALIQKTTRAAIRSREAVELSHTCPDFTAIFQRGRFVSRRICSNNSTFFLQSNELLRAGLLPDPD